MRGRVRSAEVNAWMHEEMRHPRSLLFTARVRQILAEAGYPYNRGGNGHWYFYGLSLREPGPDGQPESAAPGPDGQPEPG
jgi:hypothetical protein